MVVSFVAYGCTSRQQKKTENKSPNLHFHRFPWRRPELLKKWIVAVRRKDWNPTKYSSLCRNHFSEDCYMFGSNTDRLLLKDAAVPDVFSFPDHLLPPPKKRRRLIQRHLPEKD